MTARKDGIDSPAAARRLGVRDALGLPAIVLFASMSGFGSLARESGLPLWATVASTVGIWGLPGQVVMAEMFALGAPVFAIAVGVAVANARFLPMTLALMPYFHGWRGPKAGRFGLSHFVSLNPWAAALRRFPGMAPEYRVPYFLCFSSVCVTAATAGTALGYELAGTLPRPVTLGLVFLSPAFFAIVFADVRHRAGVLALLFGAALGPVLHAWEPHWGLPATGLVAGTAAFLIDRILVRRRRRLP